MSSVLITTLIIFKVNSVHSVIKRALIAQNIPKINAISARVSYFYILILVKIIARRNIIKTQLIILVRNAINPVTIAQGRRTINA